MARADAPPGAAEWAALPPLPRPPAKEMRGPTEWCNWVIPGRVIAGAYPASMDDADTEAVLTLLLELGVNTFVCLQAEVNIHVPDHVWRSGASLRPYIRDAQRILSRAHERGGGGGGGRIAQQRIDFLHLPIIDGSVTTDSAMHRLAEDCCERVLRGERMYIHCWGGHGRTGTLVAVMLGRLYGLPYATALRHTQAYHDSRVYPQGVRSPQTPIQRAQVRRLLLAPSPTARARSAAASPTSASSPQQRRGGSPMIGGGGGYGERSGYAERGADAEAGDDLLTSLPPQRPPAAAPPPRAGAAAAASAAAPGPGRLSAASSPLAGAAARAHGGLASLAHPSARSGVFAQAFGGSGAAAGGGAFGLSSLQQKLATPLTGSGSRSASLAASLPSSLSSRPASSSPSWAPSAAPPAAAGSVAASSLGTSPAGARGAGLGAGSLSPATPLLKSSELRRGGAPLARASPEGLGGGSSGGGVRRSLFEGLGAAAAAPGGRPSGGGGYRAAGAPAVSHFPLPADLYTRPRE